MALGRLSRFLRHTILHLGGPQPSSDGELLGRFAESRDQAAFQELLARHGAMVMGVCRRILGHAQDAEDAYQATFLLLARKAAAVAALASVGGWLHGTACRTALCARKLRGRRQAHARSDQRSVAAVESPGAIAEHQEFLAVFDQELHALPEQYSLPLVLHYLEQRSVAEVANCLGCAPDAAKQRLARAREKLRERLRRRGLGLSVGGLAALESPAAWATSVPQALTAQTAHAAASQAVGTLSPPVAALIAAGQSAASSLKLKACLALFVLLSVLGGAALWSRHGGTTVPGGGFSSGTVLESRPHLPPGTTLGVSFLPQGQRITLATATALEVWDSDASGTHRLQFRERGPGAVSVAFSRDRTRLAVCYQDGSIRVCDLAVGKRIAALSDTGALPGKPAKPLFAPDGQQVAIMVPGQGIILWSLRTGQVRNRIKLPGLAEAAFTPDGALLLALDGPTFSLRCWDQATLAEKPLATPAGWAVVAVSPGGRTAVALRGYEVGLLDIFTTRVQPLFKRQHDGVMTFVLSPTGDSLVYQDVARQRTAVWDVALGKDLFVVQPGPSRCTYTQDGKRISLYEDEDRDGARIIALDELRNQHTSPGSGKP